MSLGIQSDIIVCRSEDPINNNVRNKISIAANVPVSRVINSTNTNSIYNIPIYLNEIKVDDAVFDVLNIEKKELSNEFDKWKEFVNKGKGMDKKITIGITGKYTNIHDSYLSILKALEHCSYNLGVGVDIKWIETTEIEQNGLNPSEVLKGIDGIIVPGGFGKRGTEGKIECIKYARENNIPFLGLCYAFQMAVVDFARNVCGLEKANSTEIDHETNEPVVDILPEQKKIEGLGGTMRLGGHDVEIKEGTIAHKLYNNSMVRERFRHRYECNPDYIEILEKNGMMFSGKAPNHPIMQILELPKHKFFIATQFHPEFSSRPLNPHPLFKGFVESCL
jgi:CTP synthase